MSERSSEAACTINEEQLEHTAVEHGATSRATEHTTAVSRLSERDMVTALSGNHLHTEPCMKHTPAISYAPKTKRKAKKTVMCAPQGMSLCTDAIGVVVGSVKDGYVTQGSRAYYTFERCYQELLELRQKLRVYEVERVDMKGTVSRAREEKLLKLLDDAEPVFTLMVKDPTMPDNMRDKIEEWKRMYDCIIEYDRSASFLTVKGRRADCYRVQALIGGNIETIRTQPTVNSAVRLRTDALGIPRGTVGYVVDATETHVSVDFDIPHALGLCTLEHDAVTILQSPILWCNSTKQAQQVSLLGCISDLRRQLQKEKHRTPTIARPTIARVQEDSFKKQVEELAAQVGKKNVEKKMHKKRAKEVMKLKEEIVTLQRCTEGHKEEVSLYRLEIERLREALRDEHAARVAAEAQVPLEGRWQSEGDASVLDIARGPKGLQICINDNEDGPFPMHKCTGHAVPRAMEGIAEYKVLQGSSQVWLGKIDSARLRVLWQGAPCEQVEILRSYKKLLQPKCKHCNHI
eukprot:TRINITY_DN15359_c0_g1_i1.p1 TRINITY_DN15359_c0_g1~~TRINITY_DN15359_c0_g1_i1.p1  ORF type:complete len:518 (+),score=73.18 TRINITY_DN15359_c0_g1_i1:78-1631(+)